MTEYPVEDAVEQQAPVLPDDDDTAEVVTARESPEVDPADAYEQELVVPLDEDEWR